MNETFPKKIENPREVILSDFIKVIRDKKVDTYIGSALPLSKVKVCKEWGTVTVIAQTPTHGEIYQYGNHGDYWEQIGTSCGYA